MVLTYSKIKVRNSKEAILFQKWAFKKGFKWPTSGKNLSYLDQHYFYLEDSYYICRGSSEKYFNDNDFKEIFIEDILKEQTLEEIWF